MLLELISRTGDKALEREAADLVHRATHARFAYNRALENFIGAPRFVCGAHGPVVNTGPGEDLDAAGRELGLVIEMAVDLLDRAQQIHADLFAGFTNPPISTTEPVVIDFSIQHLAVSDGSVAMVEVDGVYVVPCS